MQHVAGQNYVPTTELSCTKKPDILHKGNCHYNMPCFMSSQHVPLCIPLLLYIELAISFLIGRKRTVNFQNQRL